jgi:uncharacterized membrane protein YccC
VPGFAHLFPEKLCTSWKENGLSLATLGTHAAARDGRPTVQRLMNRVEAAGPALLFGLRLWASVCLALYLAFWLELDHAYWAGASAAVVCQPHLGESLRKGRFRMIGTAIGAIAIVALTARFPQQRIGFLLGLAGWVAACGFVAALLRNFAAYAAALAGFTAAIIASDELGAVGGLDGQAFTLAITRASEICIGILCAGIILAGTDLGGARRRLAAQLADVAAEVATGYVCLSRSSRPREAAIADAWNILGSRIVALDPVIDEALGEASDLRPRSPILYAATEGLFASLSGLWISMLHLERLPDEDGRRKAALVRESLPSELRTSSARDSATNWIVGPSQTRRSFLAATRALVALPNCDPSLRLLADEAARALLGLSRTLDASALLVGDPIRRFWSRRRRADLPDWAPAALNGARTFAAICAVEMFWILTAWPNGAEAIAFAAISVILFTLRGDRAYSTSVSFMVGACLSAALAAIVKFAVLPGVEGFWGFSLAIGVVLVPVGALLTQPRLSAMCAAIIALFIPLLAPADALNYDPQQFANSVLAVIGGVAAGALALCLLPPLSPEQRTRRLLALTLGDFRRLASPADRWSIEDWKHHVHSRFLALPDATAPRQRSQLAAMVLVGSETIRLRRIVGRFDLGFDASLDSALRALARGESLIAIKRLSDVDRMLAALPESWSGARARLRARGSILAISEVLVRYASYFDSRGRDELY